MEVDPDTFNADDFKAGLLALMPSVAADEVEITIEVTTQLKLDIPVDQVDTEAMEPKLAAAYNVQPSMLTITVSAGSAVLDVTIKTPADSPEAASALKAADVAPASLGSALGVTVEITKAPKTSVVSKVTSASADAASGISATLGSLLGDPEAASKALGVEVKEVSKPETVFVAGTGAGADSAGAGGAGAAAGGGAAALLFLLLGYLYYRKKFPKRKPPTAPTKTNLISRPGGLDMVEV